MTKDTGEVYCQAMDPVCFHIGTKPVYWFGILAASGFGAALWHWTRLAKTEGRSAEYASDIVLWIMIGGLLGARIAYVLANWAEYAGNWPSIFRIDQGGLIYYGGFLGGAAAIVLFSRRRREPILGVADFVVSGIPLGHALGRIGCYLNGCCYGMETKHWIGAVFHGRHPTQLYECAGNIIIYICLSKFYMRKKYRGQVLFLYFISYAVLRFVVEFFRGDPRQRLVGVSVAQWLSVGLFVAGISGWKVLQQRNRNQSRNQTRP